MKELGGNDKEREGGIIALCFRCLCVCVFETMGFVASGGHNDFSGFGVEYFIRGWSGDWYTNPSRVFEQKTCRGMM